MAETTRWSWYGGPNDSGDNNRPASGIPNTIPGIARYDQSTLRGFFVVQDGGQKWLVQQTDIGPHPSTGRGVDVNASAIKLFGYNEGNFPTDKQVRVTYVGKNLAQARARALKLGARIPGYRHYGGAAGGLGETMGKAAKPNGHAPLEGGSLSELLGSITGQQAQRQMPEQTALPVPGFLSQPPHIARFARRRLTAGL